MELLAQAYSGRNSGLYHAGIISSITAYSPFMGTVVQQQAYYNNVTETTGCTASIEIIDCLKNCKLGRSHGLIKLEKLIGGCLKWILKPIMQVYTLRVMPLISAYY